MAEPAPSLIHELRRLVGRAWVSSDADAVLVGRYVNENAEDAFAALVHRHGPMVLRACRRVIGDVHLAEDAFQATFLLLARKARTIRRRHSVAAWLFGAALRVARKARRGKSVQAVAEPALDRADPQADPLSQLTARELLTVLDEEIQHLPEVYRLPLILCALEGLSQKDAARWLGWSEGSVRGRLDRGRERLRVRLVRRGVTLTAAQAILEATRGAVRAGLTVRLMNHTAEAALAYAGYQATAMAAASPEIVKLAGAALGGTTVLTLKLGLVAALLMGITAIGVAGLVPWAGEATRTQETGKGAVAPLRQAQSKNDKPRLDQYGDPLPAGALARLGTVRFRHDGDAWDVVFSADGKMLAGHTRSGLMIWDTATGREIQRLQRSRTGLSGHMLDFSPTGPLLAISRFGGATVELCEIPSGKTIRTLEVPPGIASKLTEMDAMPCPVVRFAPDGKSLAFSYRKQIHIFDVATGQHRISFGDDITLISDLVFSPDGKTVALAASEPCAQVWEIATGKMVYGLHDSDKNFGNAVAFSHDGKTLAVGLWDRITLYETISGKELRHFGDPKMQYVQGLRFTPDGNTLVSGGQDGKIRVWDVATGNAIHTLNSHWMARSVAFSPDCKMAATGTVGSAIKVWDPAAGKELFAEFQGHAAQVLQLAFAPDGKSLFSSEDGWQIRHWDTATWKPVKVLPDCAETLSISPDGKRLAWVRPSDTVRVWDLALDKEAMTIKVPEAKVVGSVVFSPDGLKLFTLDSGGANEKTWAPYYLRQWDAMTGKQEQKWMLPSTFATVDAPLVVPNGKAVLGYDGTNIQFHDIKSGRERTFNSPPESWPALLALSKDFRLLASGDCNNGFALRIWEMTTGKEVLTLKGHENPVTVAAWSTDGCVVASAEDSIHYNTGNKGTMTIRLWSAISGQQLVRFGDLSVPVKSLAISPDGHHLAAGMQDSTILVWDISQVVGKARPTAIKLTATELEGCWTALAGADAAKAHRAAWTLIAAEPRSLSFLQNLLKPVAVADAGKIQQWIADLDSDKFAVRQRAAKELVSVGEQVRAPVEKALEANISLEMRRRLEQVIKDLPDIPGPETMRTMRAIMALEKVGSAEARTILAALAKGAPTARETKEAQAALTRLAHELTLPPRGR